MFDFIKKLFIIRKKKVTLVLIQENKPDEPEMYSVVPNRLFHLGIYISVITAALIFTILGLTPIGFFLFDREDSSIHQQVVDLSTRLNKLSDSLNVRDAHLKSIQIALRNEADTSFSTIDYEGLLEKYSAPEINHSLDELLSGQDYDLSKIQEFNENRILYSDKISTKPEFPAASPLNGILTQKFDPQNKHFGIDIAASKGSIVRAFANGVVISAEWSINYGNSIQIQHGDGYISIIKHCSSLLRKEGDIVLKGDGIGVLGLSGVLNTGPHIHIELWHDGIALDPELYLLIN